MKSHAPLQLFGQTAAPCSHAWSRPLSALKRQQRHKQQLAAACKANPRPLLLDNYDSYTYNLYQIIAEAYGGTDVFMGQLNCGSSSSCNSTSARSSVGHMHRHATSLLESVCTDNWIPCAQTEFTAAISRRSARYRLFIARAMPAAQGIHPMCVIWCWCKCSRPLSPP
jgi:hypothetical protein